MKIAKSELIKIIKEEIQKTDLNEVMNLSSVKGLSSDDQDIRNDITEAQKLFRDISKPGVLYQMGEQTRSQLDKILRTEQEELNQRIYVAKRLKANKFSDEKNIMNLELLKLHLGALAKSVREGTLRVKEEFSYDPSREKEEKKL